MFKKLSLLMLAGLFSINLRSQSIKTILQDELEKRIRIRLTNQMIVVTAIMNKAGSQDDTLELKKIANREGNKLESLSSAHENIDALGPNSLCYQQFQKLLAMILLHKSKEANNKHFLPLSTGQFKIIEKFNECCKNKG